MKLSFTGMNNAEIQMMFKTGVSKVVLISSIRNRVLLQLIIKKKIKLEIKEIIFLVFDNSLF